MDSSVRVHREAVGWKCGKSSSSSRFNFPGGWQHGLPRFANNFLNSSWVAYGDVMGSWVAGFAQGMDKPKWKINFEMISQLEQTSSGADLVDLVGLVGLGRLGCGLALERFESCAKWQHVVPYGQVARSLLSSNAA